LYIKPWSFVKKIIRIVITNPKTFFKAQVSVACLSGGDRWVVDQSAVVWSAQVWVE
jgi:hypothetical protein